MSSRFAFASTATLLAALALAGCTPNNTGGVPTSGDGFATDTPTSEALSLEPPECLIGDWYISQAELQVFYDSVNEASDGAVTFTVQGDTGLSFDGTSFEYTPDLRLSISTPSTEGVGTLVGTIAGPYSASDTMIAAENDSVDVEYDYLVGGVEQDAAALFASLITTAPVNDADYECTPNGPLVSFDNGFGRVPVQLVPLP